MSDFECHITIYKEFKPLAARLQDEYKFGISQIDDDDMGKGFVFLTFHGDELEETQQRMRNITSKLPERSVRRQKIELVIHDVRFDKSS